LGSGLVGSEMGIRDRYSGAGGPRWWSVTGSKETGGRCGMQRRREGWPSFWSKWEWSPE
ncbi:hypothetical protein HQQ75_26065, partial [Corallococcus exiguus]|nr:hypothetical protein [Corallococcus exiguus]